MDEKAEAILHKQWSQSFWTFSLVLLSLINILVSIFSASSTTHVDPDIQTIALWILLMLVLLLLSFSLFYPFDDLPLMIFVFQLIFLFELIFVFFFVSCIVAMMELPLMQWTCLEAVQKTLGWWQNHAAVGWYADNGNAIFGILSERELNAWLPRKKQGTRWYSESSSEAIV